MENLAIEEQQLLLSEIPVVEKDPSLLPIIQNDVKRVYEYLRQFTPNWPVIDAALKVMSLSGSWRPRTS